MTREHHVLLWVGFAALLSAGLGVAFLGFLYFTYRHPVLNVLSAKEYDEVAREGTPLVLAICEYTARVGLAPLDIKDLPTGSPAAGAWTYRWTPWSWDLEQRLPGGTTVTFSSDRRWPGWGVEAYDLEAPEITVEAPRVESVPPPPEERHASIHREFERRIAAHPEDVIHVQGYFTYLFFREEFDRAREMASALTGTGPTNWWRTRALARLALASKTKPGIVFEPVERLLELAETNPGFVSWTMVSSVFTNAGEPEEAIRAVEKAVACPVREQPEVEDGYVLDAFAWHAAVTAHLARRFELVLAVCDRWEELEETQGYAGQSYHAFRAAALLGLDRAEDAEPHVVRAIAAEKRQATWADDLEELKAAIRRADLGYRWTGCDGYPRSINVFVTYR